MHARDAAELARAQERGERLRFLFFWGHRPPRGGGVGPGCLSQWWEAPFTLEETVYRTAEHFMMAEKARLFGDGEAREAVLAAAHPGEAKKLGRTVRGFDETTWVGHRRAVVVRGNLAKFGQHRDLGDFLLGTGERVLVEASPVDRIWGIGLAADDERAGDVSRWRGQNLLGFALMDVREQLHALHRAEVTPTRQ
ncbi:NADAR family protein [Thermobifida halotolerans]|uniref:NADAR family protein n=1 Tax=Thermobifida halotolerans TaxID=483545 RepID=A0AA97M2H8_9ACTN|nr:NADAR family protein [Thermobifida halotolerans]UOE17972.1 NADAR family protein [Thermobifida halotolerans]